MVDDPLLQPFQLKHLTLKNKVMTTSHEPAYPEEGMPKERYRVYHEERAKAGVALAMTAGSAAVSKDSPPVFNNVLAYSDDVVPWIQNLTDACHEHGCAVMIQLTRLGATLNNEINSLSFMKNDPDIAVIAMEVWFIKRFGDILWNKRK